jgi:4,5-dihydroxyphthalate decarboxylase
MTQLQITIATGDYDRIRALREGRIPVQGCDVNYLTLPPEELFFRALRNHEFDVCELSMSSYMMAVARGGETPYLAIPVFMSRTFRHSAIYVRTDRGIDAPAGLKGKRVGVPEYQITAAVWARGLLDDDHGVGPWDFEWFQGGLEQPGRVEKLALKLPPSIRLSAIPETETLDSQLRRGELDALIAMRPPRCFLEGHPQVRRLFPDYQPVEADYFARTGIFPIMHVIGVRRALVERHPWLANSLYTAFLDAKTEAMRELDIIAALPVTFPWLGPFMDKTKQAMGADYWPYGIDANRRTLEALVKYAHRHGTTERQLEIAELFAPTTLDRFKI